MKRFYLLLFAMVLALISFTGIRAQTCIVMGKVMDE
jgi:hypothetical protein